MILGEIICLVVSSEFVLCNTCTCVLSPEIVVKKISIIKEICNRTKLQISNKKQIYHDNVPQTTDNGKFHLYQACGSPWLG